MTDDRVSGSRNLGQLETDPNDLGPLAATGGQSSDTIDRLGRPLATWWQGVGAFLHDMLVVWVPGSVVIAIVYFAAATAIENPDGSTHKMHPYTSLAFTFVNAAHLAYFAILDGRSQTVGKRAVGFAVRSKATGSPIGFGRALVRWIIFGTLWDLLIVPGLVNALSPIWDRSNQAWRDHAVGSVVVQLR